MNTLLLLFTIAVASAACAPVRQRPVAIVALFGPAVGRLAISGRADDPAGGIWLMVGGASLVRIDTRSGSTVKLGHFGVRIARGCAVVIRTLHVEGRQP